MINKSILDNIKIPDNPDDLIRERQKDYEQNQYYYDWDVQEEIKDQIIRMGGGNLIGLPSQYDNK